MRSRVALFALLLLPSIVGAAGIRPVPGTESGYTDHCLFTEGPSQEICDVAILADQFLDLTGVRFRVYTTDITWAPVQVLSDYTTVGNWNDLSVGFGSCVSAPVVAATIRYLCPGDSPCGRVYVGSAPGFGAPFGIDCSFEEIQFFSNHMTVNGIYDMLPGMPDPDCMCPIVATTPSTWGKVKALYRN